MYKKITAEFDSAYLADRAYARVKSNGIPSGGMKVSHKYDAPEPGLFIAQPYPRQLYTPYNNLSCGLPETTGTSIRMDTTVLNGFGDSGGRRDSVRLEITVDESHLAAVRRILVNCGGRHIQS